MHHPLEVINERIENYRQSRNKARITLDELHRSQQEDKAIEYYEQNIAPLISKISEMTLGLESFWVSFDKKFPAL